jgi:hypothetical protein
MAEALNTLFSLCCAARRPILLATRVDTVPRP